MRHATAAPQVAVQPEAAVHGEDHPVTSLSNSRYCGGTRVTRAFRSVAGYDSLRGRRSNRGRRSEEQRRSAATTARFCDVADQPVAVNSVTVTILLFDVVSFIESSWLL
jgi:hypothetical protein